MTYSELNQQQQDKVSELHDKLGIFWAFSNEQFEKALKKLNLPKGEKITSIGSGGYIPSKNSKQFIKELDKLDNWYKEQQKLLDPEKVIEYELSNYECYYTGDISDAWDMLKDMGYTKEQVVKVYNKNKHKHYDD